ncbi:penicillin-binding protein 2B [Streptococcus pneumoniae]|nr:penicillin-binding protein 2B [Streptococcus pneumoniae]
MSGIKHDLKTGELTPDSLGTVTNVFVPGSVVKAATISSGWENGVLSGNQTLTDQSIVFQGSAPINSWYTALLITLLMPLGSLITIRRCSWLSM